MICLDSYLELYTGKGKLLPPVPLSLIPVLDPAGHCRTCGRPFYKDAYPLACNESNIDNKVGVNHNFLVSFVRRAIREASVDFVLMFVRGDAGVHIHLSSC